MKIERFEYRRLFSFGRYENETLGFSIALENKDSPQDAFVKATKMMETAHLNHMLMITAKTQIDIDTNRVNDIEAHITRETQDLDEARGYIERVREHPELADGRCVNLKHLQEHLTQLEESKQATTEELRCLKDAKEKLTIILKEGKWFDEYAGDSTPIPPELLSGNTRRYSDWY